jgi:hypothetical protein
MTDKQIFELFAIEDIIALPDAIMRLLEGDIALRDEVYIKLLEMNNNDLSHDWFQEIYETELAQRNQRKQDFTPNDVSKLASLLTGNPKGWIHEPTAGNGSMLIVDWYTRRRSMLPFEYYPSEHMISCWELSNRAIPILLLNLSIRGMMGYVFHGDVLTQEVKMKYVLLNRKNDMFGFSEIIKDPDNKLTIRQKK